MNQADVMSQGAEVLGPVIEPIAPGPLVGPSSFGMTELLNGYAGVFLVSFLVTLVATPFVRKLAIAMEIIDRPDESRKQHRYPIAYLGGLAVFMGVMAAIVYSVVLVDGAGGALGPVPFSIIIGLLAITFTGLADDVWGWDPRLKIMGQLVAAAALALEDTGIRVAEGALLPLLGSPAEVLLTIGPVQIFASYVYEAVGTLIIGLFVVGGCNAMNLIDGLDGLCSGTAGIMAIALLVLSLMMAAGTVIADPYESMAGVRIVLCLSLLGAVLGFLPWNFNPAVIFLGDCGSLLPPRRGDPPPRRAGPDAPRVRGADHLCAADHGHGARDPQAQARGRLDVAGRREPHPPPRQARPRRREARGGCALPRDGALRRARDPARLPGDRADRSAADRLCHLDRAVRRDRGSEPEDRAPKPMGRTARTSGGRLQRGWRAQACQ